MERKEAELLEKVILEVLEKETTYEDAYGLISVEQAIRKGINEYLNK